jgi:hypothetical protein
VVDSTVNHLPPPTLLQLPPASPSFAPLVLLTSLYAPQILHAFESGTTAYTLRSSAYTRAGSCRRRRSRWTSTSGSRPPMAKQSKSHICAPSTDPCRRTLSTRIRPHPLQPTSDFHLRLRSSRRRATCPRIISSQRTHRPPPSRCSSRPLHPPTQLQMIPLMIFPTRRTHSAHRSHTPDPGPSEPSPPVQTTRPSPSGHTRSRPSM